MSRKFWLVIPLLVTPLFAQDANDQARVLQEILRRLDNLEKQNHELLAEIKELKQQQASVSPLDERVKVNEERVAEQAQTKVESSQKYPVWLYGTLLFNAFNNSKNPSTALGQYGLLSGPANSGATLRQTILGLSFEGPSLPGGGHVQGDLAMDFWAGSSIPSDSWLRIRRAGISLAWPDTTVFFGQDKPLISPYEPNSLAEVGVPSMAGTGNLWYWLPQARLERRAHLSSTNGIDAQLAVLQVGSYLYSSTVYPGSVRPALEARLAFWHKVDDSKKFEFAPGFHISSSHLAGVDVATKIGSVDWLYKPISKLEFKGAAYYGQNVASLGGLGNSFSGGSAYNLRPVVSGGGWAQISVPVNSRVTLNSFGGIENDQPPNSYGNAISRSSSFAGNVMFHLSGNVLLSVEAQRLWTRTFAGQPDNYNHYDLALAYLF